MEAAPESTIGNRELLEKNLFFGMCRPGDKISLSRIKTSIIILRVSLGENFRNGREAIPFCVQASVIMTTFRGMNLGIANSQAAGLDLASYNVWSSAHCIQPD
jgi:hypothetical protein